MKDDYDDRETYLKEQIQGILEDEPGEEHAIVDMIDEIDGFNGGTMGDVGRYLEYTEAVKDLEDDLEIGNRYDSEDDANYFWLEE